MFRSLERLGWKLMLLPPSSKWAVGGRDSIENDEGCSTILY